MSNKEIRLCKIVWNSNHWIQPCERSWSPSYIDDDNKGYEQKHGFVHEDWLFNSQFLIGGYQYGYIRGVGKLNASVKKLDIVYLFTINPNTKERFYLGKLYNVERIQADEIPTQVKKAIKSYHSDMVNQLKNLGADYNNLKMYPYETNLRFKIEAIEIFPSPLPIVSSWFDKKYFRTMPMKLNNQLLSLLQDLEKALRFKFTPSSPLGKKEGYDKHTKKGKTTVTKVHQEIEVALYNYLIKVGIKKNNIACDTTSFGGKLADVVVKNGTNDFEIYEIKTDSDLRRGLRDAIGQLIDYSTWENGINIKSIKAVLPETDLSQTMLEFIIRVKKRLKIDFKILMYNKERNSFTEI